MDEEPCLTVTDLRTNTQSCEQTRNITHGRQAQPAEHYLMVSSGAASMLLPRQRPNIFPASFVMISDVHTSQKSSSYLLSHCVLQLSRVDVTLIAEKSSVK